MPRPLGFACHLPFRLGGRLPAGGQSPTSGLGLTGGRAPAAGRATAGSLAPAGPAVAMLPAVVLAARPTAGKVIHFVDKAKLAKEGLNGH